MALKNERYFDIIPSSYKVIGAAPIDLRQVVQNLDNLYGQIAQQTHTWDVDGDIIAFDGMLVGVFEEQKIYMCIDYLHPYDSSSWKLQTDDSAIHQITGESPIQLNPNDEYVAVSVTADSSNNITINSSIQLAQPFTIDSSNSSIPTGLTTDAYVKDAISQSLDWEII